MCFSWNHFLLCPHLSFKVGVEGLVVSSGQLANVSDKAFLGLEVRLLSIFYFVLSRGLCGLWPLHPSGDFVLCAPYWALLRPRDTLEPKAAYNIQPRTVFLMF